MDIQKSWERALKATEIIRSRIQPLSVHAETHLPYIFLAESSVNLGDSLVRKGEIMVEKPSIILPPHLPQFEGFDSEDVKTKDLDMLTTFFMVRGIKFPSFKYNNKTFSLDVHEGKLHTAIEHYKHELEKEENISAGLVIGPEDCWQFSILIFVASQVIRQADGDIRKLLDEFRKGEAGG